MKKSCSLCGEDIKRGQIRAECIDWGLKSHSDCLSQCELYKLLIDPVLAKMKEDNQKSSAVLIRCILCQKKPSRSKAKCAIYPTLKNAFMVPILVAQNSLDNINELRPEHSPSTFQGLGEPSLEQSWLGKRAKAPPETFEESGQASVESRLQKLEINYYISVDCLIELQKHGVNVPFAASQLGYLIEQETIDRYRGFNCKCGVSCAFSCAKCHLEGGDHADCLQAAQQPAGPPLTCLECYQKELKNLKKKNSREQTKKAFKDNLKSKLDEVLQEELPESSEGGGTSSNIGTIFFRKSPREFLDLLDKLYKVVLSKKLAPNVLM